MFYLRIRQLYSFSWMTLEVKNRKQIPLYKNSKLYPLLKWYLKWCNLNSFTEPAPAEPAPAEPAPAEPVPTEPALKQKNMVHNVLFKNSTTIFLFLNDTWSQEQDAHTLLYIRIQNYILYWNDTWSDATWIRSRNPRPRNPRPRNPCPRNPRPRNPRPRNPCSSKRTWYLGIFFRI